MRIDKKARNSNFVKEVTDYILNYFDYIKSEQERYNLKNEKIEDIVADVITIGISGFEYNLIVVADSCSFRSDVKEFSGIKINLDAFKDYFYKYLESNFGRIYPKWIDDNLSTYGNCFVSSITFKNYHSQIEKFWDFEISKLDDKVSPEDRIPGVKEGFVLTIIKN